MRGVRGVSGRRVLAWVEWALYMGALAGGVANFLEGDMDAAAGWVALALAGAVGINQKEDCCGR